MNELQIFTNDEFGQVRTLDIDGEIWFVGKDVAAALGYKNTRKAIGDHVEYTDTFNTAFADVGTRAARKILDLKELISEVKEKHATKAEVAKLSETVGTLVSNGGEQNTIEGVQVNGKDLTPDGERKVNVIVPENTSDLTNDSEFQTKTDVSTAISQAVSESGHAVFKKVDMLPEYAQAEENVLYLLKNTKTGHYDIYAKVEGSTQLELIDDTTVDLREYSNTEEIKKMLDSYAKKTESTKVERSNTNGNIKIDGEETKVYELPEDVLTEDDLSTSEEIRAMLDQIYGE